MLRDNSFHEVGQEYGTGFCSPSPRREMGRVRADILSDGHGSDYGAFHLLGESDDDDDYGDDDSDDDIYVPPSWSKRRAGRGKNDEAISHDNPEASCVGCGCVVLFVIGILTLLRLCS